MVLGQLLEDVIFEKILKKLFGEEGGLSETLEALDPGKWGTPLTKGEAHLVNDIITESYHSGTGGPNSPLTAASQQRRNGRSLVFRYNYIKHEFGYFRRGWLAEYIADAFAPNAFQKIVFLLLARMGSIGEVIVDMMTLKFWMGGTAGSPPQTIGKKMLAGLVWMPFFFYSTTVLLGVLVTEGLYAVFTPAFYFFLVVFLLTYVKWMGKYGLWMPPVAKANTIGSAVSFALLWATTVAVVFRSASFLPFIPSVNSWPILGQPILSTPPVMSELVSIILLLYVMYGLFTAASSIASIAGSYPIVSILLLLAMLPVAGAIIGTLLTPIFGIGSLEWPNPLYLGLGHLVLGAAWPTLIMLWGMAGVGNAFYGELEEAHSKSAKQAKRIADLVAERVNTHG